VDAEAQVEKALIQELETAFKEFGIEARIFSVDGPRMLGAPTWRFQCTLELNGMFASTPSAWLQFEECAPAIDRSDP
jgi:hypothetical protein